MKVQTKYLSLFLISNLFFINFASAATCDSSDGSPFGKCGIFYNTFSDLTGLISSAVIGLIIGATIAMFFFALFRGMMRTQGGDDVKKNKDILLWGIGILFVMISIWGIIIFFQDAILGKYKDKTITLPTIPNTAGYNSPAGNNPGASTGVTNLIVGSNCKVHTNCKSFICDPISKKCMDNKEPPIE